MSLEAGPEFEDLVAYLREERAVDLSGYKRPSLVRRVAKRCQELGLDSFAAYLDHLQVHSEELPILFDRILINVTEFFRDPAAWAYLAENIVPTIVARPGQIRVWSAGAASGEEAYSIAITLCEALGSQEFLDRVKIYATDVDDEALNKARTGYTAKEVEGLDAELVSRYFDQQGDKLLFKTGLRRAMIFGRHDLMQDAPISRLDLLICRNTLMYFTAEAQGRILTRFHYAVRDDGYLFLGRAEMLLTHSSLFVPVDLKHRVFSKVAHVELRERLLNLTQHATVEAGDQGTRHVRVRELASEGVPMPQLVIDALGTLVTANHAARRIFGLPLADVGRPLKDLQISYSPVELRTPIERAIRERRVVSLDPMELETADGQRRVFEIHVAPLVDEETNVAGTSVTYTDVTQVARLQSELDRARQDVETAYEELQSSNEELETTNEELQSTVEELETTNEELQSTNEELETMNAELESTNTELQSVNTDLQQRSDAVAKLNELLSAITGRIPLGAVVLDRDLTVLVWNEHAADLWGLRSDEVVGKLFFDLDIGLPSNQIRSMTRAVVAGRPLHDEAVLEAVTRRGKSIRCRVMTHTLGVGGEPGGVVMLMEELKGAEQEAEKASR